MVDETSFNQAIESAIADVNRMTPKPPPALDNEPPEYRIIQRNDDLVATLREISRLQMIKAQNLNEMIERLVEDFATKTRLVWEALQEHEKEQEALSRRILEMHDAVGKKGNSK